MRLLYPMLGLLTCQTNAKPIEIRTDSPDTVLAQNALENTYKILAGTLSDGSNRTNTACTKENIAIRKEYGDMSKAELTDYINAVRCILQAPSKLNNTQYPGAKTRYDDFIVVHMNMTPSVHGTANFLHWHRYYVWAYESALRNECGYKGYQPYWNWGKYTEATKSPIWSGDEWSMGGNGGSIVNHTSSIGQGSVRVPPGKGGGCVTTGPFGNMTIHLGPIETLIDVKLPANPRKDGYGYNPRCLRRDVNDFFTKSWLTPQRIADHITSSTDIAIFQDTIQIDGDTTFALHTGGHFTIWGDPGGDVYVSPGDPTFWLHHGQLDRHWWIWQNQEADPSKRVQQYMGGTVWLAPVSPAGKTTDMQWLDVVDPKGDEGGEPASALMSTTAGPFCYIYQ